MRIKCPCCSTKATVYSRNSLTPELENIYARCQNKNCTRFTQTFVLNLSLAHWIDPKAESMQMAFEMFFNHMPEHMQKDFIKKHSPVTLQ